MKQFMLMLLVLIVLMVYLIYRNMKTTREHFESLIEIHFNETNNAQFLYKVDLSTNLGQHISINMGIANLENIIALFPYNNDIVYMLDSALRLYRITITPLISNSVLITGFNDNVTGKPIKLVSNHANSLIHVLTTKGKVYTLNSNTTSISGDGRELNALDITLSTNGLYYLNKEGHINGIITDTRFLQIIGSGPYLFGLATDNMIYKIYFAQGNGIMTPVLQNPIQSNRIRLVANQYIFGYIDEFYNFNYMLNNDTEMADANFHTNTKHVIINDTDSNAYSIDNIRRIVLNTGDNKIYVSDNTGNLSPKPILDGTGNEINVEFFTGNNLQNVFVLVNQMATSASRRLTPLAEITSTTTPTQPENPALQCPLTVRSADCGLCTESQYSQCPSIFLAINSLISGEPGTICTL